MLNCLTLDMVKDKQRYFKRQAICILTIKLSELYLVQGCERCVPIGVTNRITFCTTSCPTTRNRVVILVRSGNTNMADAAIFSATIKIKYKYTIFRLYTSYLY